jgi:hypothetical protein
VIASIDSAAPSSAKTVGGAQLADAPNLQQQQRRTDEEEAQGGVG